MCVGFVSVHPESQRRSQSRALACFHSIFRGLLIYFKLAFSDSVWFGLSQLALVWHCIAQVYLLAFVNTSQVLLAQYASI